MKDLERIQKVWYRIPKWWQDKIMKLVELALKKEIWKLIPIEGYGKYEISNKGRLRNKEHKCVLSVGTIIIGRNRSVGGVVLTAFSKRKPKTKMCCHVDGDGTNNFIENLYWGTSSDNRSDAVKHGTFSNPNQFKGKTTDLSLVQCVRNLKEKNLTNEQRTQFLRSEFPNSICAKKWPFEKLQKHAK